MGCVAAGPVTLPHWMFWGLVSQVQVLKAGVPQVDFKPFSGRSSSFWVSLRWWNPGRGEVYRFEVTGVARSHPPALMRAFSLLLVVQESDCFQVFSRGRCSLCSCAFSVFVGGGAVQAPLRLPSSTGTLSSLLTTSPEGFYYLQSIKPCTC